MTETIGVAELGRTIIFSFDDMIRYHGPGSPAGVAVAFKAMQRAFDLLSPTHDPSVVRSSCAPRFAVLAHGTDSRR
ncbi:hypothetical protein [Mycobacterium sp. AZCC_0083]|uniref:hypothetical protein n=1 Tax=Mycobacterium sp. AZCC_0083 TaxID=2735882 RepID=UPI0018322B06|nr:hypothetical protein [Mycobacterium sp. AZCC_0083]MBB5164579.1 hypothetical protein [Mycobacterium sp. AZCC_0083]